MKQSFALLMACLLTACSCTKPVAEPVVVKVPVAVPCNPPPLQEPYWNIQRLARDASDTQRLKAVLMDMDVSKAYIEELKAQLKACE